MASVHEFMLWTAWTLLTLTASNIKNPVHDLLFPTQNAMEKLLPKVTFATGLMEALQSKVPPTIDFFKSLPTDVRRLWGVYLVLLEKVDCRPKIYIGSSLNVAGMNTRFNCYNTGHAIPKWVQHAFDNGFTITHKGVLCWATIPNAQYRFPMRSLLLILEAFFSLALWAMHSQTKTYGMPNFLSWPMDAIQYDGCCGHVAISEMVKGEEHGLTPDQVAVKEATMEIRRKEQMIVGVRKHYAKVKAGEFEGWYERKRATTKKSHTKVKNSRKWSCEPCGKAFISQYALNDHKSRSLHLNKVNGHNYSRPDKKRKDDAVKAAKTHYCHTCKSAFRSKSVQAKHKGPRHLATVRAAQAAS